MYVHEWYKGSDTETQSRARKVAPMTKHLGGEEVKLQPFDAQKGPPPNLSIIERNLLCTMHHHSIIIASACPKV